MSKALDKFIKELDKENEIILGFQEYENKIADLEAKLSEMTEKYNACQEARKLETEFNSQDKNELKQQLAESEENIKILEEDRIIMNKTMELYVNKCKKYEQQLAEKDKVIKKLNLEAQKYYEDAYCNDFQKQTKIDYAVEQLEKVKDFCDGMKWTMVYLTKENTQTIQTVLDEIDNQIKQLKEGK